MTQLLDKLAVAKALDVHKNTIGNMMRDGRLPTPINIGTDSQPNYRWKSDELQQWIADGCPRQNEPANG